MCACICALGTKLLRPVVVKSCSRFEGASLDTKQEIFCGVGAGGRGERGAGTFSVSARTSVWHCPAVTLSYKVPTFCTSTYLSIPALRGSSALSPGGGGQIGESVSSAFSLKDTTTSNTFNSWVWWGEAKTDASRRGEVGARVRVSVCLCAGGGREGLGNYMAVLFNSPFLCKPNVTRKTD